MASLTRSQLKTSSNSTYDTNGVGGITATEVRTFNDDLIDSLITNDLTGGMSVATASLALTASSVSNGVLTPLNQFTASATIRLNNLETTSASVNISIANLNGATGSYAISASVAAVDAAQQQQINSLIAASSSYANSASFAASQLVQDGRLNNLETTSASLLIETSNLETFSASALISINALNTNSGSVNTSISNLNSATQSLQGQLTTIGGQSGSWVTESETGSFATTGSNNFVGNQRISGDLFVTSSNQIGFIRTGGLISNASIKIGDDGGNDITLTSNDVNVNLNGGDVKIYNASAGNGIQMEGPDPLIGLRDTSAPNNPFIALINRNNRLEIIDSTSTIATMNTASFNIPSASFTASLQQGYAWVGDSTGKTVTVATSSFGGALPNNLISSSAQITALGFVSSSVTASSLVTASVNLNTITFTKGDNTTFNITVNTGSSTTTDLTSLNSFTASQYVSNSFFATTASLNSYTQSTNIRLNNLETTSASVNVSISNLNSTTASQATSITNLNASSASQQISIDNLNTNSASVNTSITNINSATASLFTSASLAIVTASVNNDDITFTKGDGSQFTIQVATGSFAISASFAETASFALNGGVTQILAGPNIIVSPLSGQGQVTISSTGTGSGNFNTATGSYGSFYDTTIQTNPVANTANSMSFNETAITNGVSISGSTSPFNTYIKTENAGIYNLQFSAQLDKTDSGTDSVDIWIRKNGIDLLDTGTTITLTNNNTKTVAAWNWFVQSAANDYYQIIWSSADTDLRLFAEASSIVHPGIPSVIATVNRVDQFLSNTGSFSGSFTGTFNGYNLTEFTTTSSFNSYTSSNDQKVNSLIAATGSYVTSAITASSLVTASVSLNTITFTKGDGTTFPITVNTGSGGGTTDITALNAFTASQYVSNSFFATTGSNTFTGNQLINKNGGEFQITDPSNPQYGTTSIGISGASGGLIFKQSGSVLIEGNAGTKDLVFYGTGSFTKGIAISDSDFVAGVGITYDTTNDVVIIQKDGAYKPSLNIEGGLTASLENGYAWVGNASGRTVAVATSSFGGGGNFATTGSNSFNGNQIITGSVYISSSATVDLTVEGQIFVSSSATGGTTAPKITVSGSAGSSTINRASITTRNTTDNGGIFPSTLFTADSATQDEIGFTVDTSVFGIAGWSTGPAFYLNNDALDSYNAVLGFQNKANYTDGRVTVLTPLVAQSGSIITGSLAVQGNVNITGQYLINGVPISGSGGTIDTGSFATTGSNNFTGPQTITDAGFVNQITLDDHSGSLVLFGKGYTSSSLTHISANNASISASVANLIFKTSNTTPDTILSGSQNIFANPFTATAGFKRYIGGNANIFMGATSVPQISGSMGFSPTMNLNTGGGVYIFRGPVSSSAWTLNTNLNLGTITIGATNAEKLTSGLTLSSNTVQGTISLNATSAFLTGSTTTFSNNSVNGGVTLTLNQSAASLNNNIINDSGFTLTNNYFSASAGLGLVSFNRNNVGGQSNTLSVTGSQPAGTTNGTSYSDNFIGGGGNILFADVSTARVSGLNAYHSAIRNMIFGSNLIVSASSLLGDTTTHGSAFFGRFNSVTGNSDMTAETIFAVGTGTSTSNRKTGFLIDSGSNSFFEGAVSISGSLLLNGTSVAGIATGSFATTGSNFFNGNQRITGSLIVSGAFETTQDITIQDASGNPTLKIGRGAGNQPSNLRFGVQALATTGVGLNNIAIGNSAMQYSSQSLTTENISIGGESLQYTQEGQQIAIGTSALRYTTTGKENLAVGAFAMENNITGSQNVAIGFRSLNSITSGSRNIAIGPSSGENFKSGSNNIFIGFQTANSISGSNNVILGAYNGTGETINNNIILADGAGNKELQFSGSTWTTENNFVVSGSLSAANNIKMGRGVDKPTNKVTVGSGGLIVSNSLVTSDSYIFATNDTTVGNYSPVVSNITAGSFSLSNGGYGGNIDVMYMIVNPY